MVNSQLNFARTGAPALDAKFTSSYGPNDAERLVLEERARSARPSGSDRVNILGVGAMPLDLDKAVAMLEQWRIERRREYVCLISVHGLVVAQRDPTIRSALNHCGLAAEDGMPLVWWSRLTGFSQARRVCGSDLLDEVCASGVSRKYRHYFYGASPRVLELLVDRLQRRHPGLIVAGYRSPPFRPRPPPSKPTTSRRSTKPVRISSGSDSACPSRKDGWSSISARSTRLRCSA